MRLVDVEGPHGYFYDSEGRVCFQFGHFTEGEVPVPERVDLRRGVEYVEAGNWPGIDEHYFDSEGDE